MNVSSGDTQDFSSSDGRNRLADTLEEAITRRCDQLMTSLWASQIAGPAAAVRGACNRGLIYYQQEIAPAMDSFFTVLADDPERRVQVQAKVVGCLASVAEMYAVHDDPLRALRTLQLAGGISGGTPLEAPLMKRRDTLRQERFFGHHRPSANVFVHDLDMVQERAKFRYCFMIFELLLLAALIVCLSWILFPFI